MQKSVFSYHFFEHGYLNNCLRYCYEILYDTSSYPFRGKRVSIFFYLGLSFYFVLFRKKCFENIQKVTRFFM